MKNIAGIYIVLSFCVYLIITSILFLICKDICIYIDKKKSIKLKKQYEPLILKHLEYIECNKKLSQMEINNIKNLLKRKVGLKTFNNIVKEYNDTSKKYHITKTYMSNFEDDINRVLKKYIKSDDIVKNYAVFILGEYRITNYEINKFLIECLDTKSIYLATSALTTIAKLGNGKLFIRALQVISKNGKNINNRILNDILDQFSGNIKDLNSIMNSYSDLSESVQKSIIEYFKNNENKDFQHEFLELLKSDVSKEVRISLIKYFGVIENEEAKNIIIKILKNEDWEYRAVCANALKNYIDDDTKDAMLDSIKDKNWHVRYNSALCLLEFDDEDVIEKVLNSKDKYAIDILNYAMSIRNKVNKQTEVYSYA